METEIPQRLAAIVAADIAGYTRLMERNEAGTVAAWRRARAEVIDPTVAACRGRIVKLTGDGFLAEFPTAESAINAVLAMQAAFTALFGDPHAEHCVAFRMGVNLGDIWVDADDIYGAGVNVAARLESLAEPGGVCISGAVHDAVKHKIAARYEDLGLQRVKNVAEPIRAWRLRSAELAATTVVSHADRAPRKLGGYLITAMLAGGLATGIYWFSSRDTDRQWLLDEAVPKIEKNIDAGDWEAAYVVAKQAEKRTPGAPELAELWKRFSWRVTIPSDPPGAMVYRRAYDAPETAWEALGRTPIKDKRIPFGLSRLRFELDGHLTLDRAIGTGIILYDELPTSDSANIAFTIGTETFKLDTASTLPEDMVRVPAWHEVVNGEDLAFNDFLLDRYEVTNAQYKAFVSKTELMSSPARPRIAPVRRVLDAAQLEVLQAAVPEIYVDPVLVAYAVSIVAATREPALVGQARPREVHLVRRQPPRLDQPHPRRPGARPPARPPVRHPRRHLRARPGRPAPPHRPVSFTALAEEVTADSILARILPAVPAPRQITEERTA